MVLVPAQVDESLTKMTLDNSDGLRARAASLDSEIAVIRSQDVPFDARLENRLAERKTIQEALDAIKYPVLTLPVEIVSEAFCWTLAEGGPPSKWTTQEQVVILGQICRLWREIALSTPQLWTTIALSTGPRRCPDPAYFRTFFERAVPLPLSISIAATLEGDQTAFQTALATIVSYSHTWQSLDVHGGLSDLPFLSLPQLDLPQLSVLKLTIYGEDSDEEIRTIFHAPLLRTAHLTGVSVEVHTLPWSQLTSLLFMGEDFAQILGWTPNVVNLTLTFVGEVPHPFPPVPLAHLRSVILKGTAAFIQTEILSHIDIPLHTLGMWVCSLAPLVPPLIHPASLERLALELVPDGLDDPLSVEFLTPMRSLRRLRITLVSNRGRFSLHPLVARLANDPEFLPALESLSLFVLPVHPEFDMHVLSSMLGARSSRLQNFELRSRQELPDLEDKALDLMAMGMQIILESSPNLYWDENRVEF
ncbi:hypothetical protein C8R46DRAFT_1138036 [Mycena filopes]|nr:hypothetical protein C8R46DRAFT_1138036 [Mycena filopes]